MNDREHTVFMCLGCSQLTEPHNMAYAMVSDDGSPGGLAMSANACITHCCRKTWMRVLLHEHIEKLTAAHTPKKEASEKR